MSGGETGICGCLGRNCAVDLESQFLMGITDEFMFFLSGIYGGLAFCSPGFKLQQPQVSSTSTKTRSIVCLNRVNQVVWDLSLCSKQRKVHQTSSLWHESRVSFGSWYKAGFGIAGVQKPLLCPRSQCIVLGHRINFDLLFVAAFKCGVYIRKGLNQAPLSEK